MSKVINLDGHLNDDQLYLCFQYLKFNEQECKYLKILHQYQRSQIKERKSLLKTELEQYRKQFQKVDQHLTSRKITREEEALFSLYFLNPNIQLVHIFLTIEQYRKDPFLILNHIDIHKEELTKALDVLIQLDVIEIQNESYRLLKENIYLPAESHLWKPYQTLVKNNGFLKAQQLTSELINSFAIVFSCSEDNWVLFREKMAAFIKTIESEVSNDKNPEVILQMNVDFLPWNKS